MAYNDPAHRDFDPPSPNTNDPFVPDRSSNNYLGMSLGIGAIVLVILGALLWTPSPQ